MKIHYIVDPAAHNGLLVGMEQSVRTHLKDLGIDGEFTKIIGKNDAEKVTRLALERQFDAVVAVGSDHTLNEVGFSLVDWLTARDQSIKLGYIPLDPSKSAVADAMGIDSWEYAAEIISQKNTREIPVCFADETMLFHKAVVTTTEEHNQNRDKSANNSLKHKLFSRISESVATAHHEQFNFEIHCKDSRTISGQATSIKCYNDRFLSAKNEPKLRIVVENTPQERGRSGRHNQNSITQIFDKEISIKTNVECTYQVNGSHYSATWSKLGVSDFAIEFFTDRLLEV